jgi:hypothetical protein
MSNLMRIALQIGNPRYYSSVGMPDALDDLHPTRRRTMGNAGNWHTTGPQLQKSTWTAG